MPDQPRRGSYHNHPAYCDGAGTVAAYAAAALDAGLTSLGISSHTPVPFASEWNMPLARLDAYRADVAAVRAAHAGRLPIYLGLEVDYLAADVAPDAADFYRRHNLAGGLDYIVFSTHFVGRRPSGEPWAVDSTAERFASQLDQVFGGDVRRLLEDYWARVAAMARLAPSWNLPVIAGHIDKAKMWNVGGRSFDEAAPWYLDAAEAALQAIAAGGLVVEVNTAGLFRDHGESYPGPRLLRRARELGIPVTISADAHQPAHVARGFDRAAAILRDAGHREIMLLVDGRWEATPLA